VYYLVLLERYSINLRICTVTLFKICFELDDPCVNNRKIVHKHQLTFIVKSYTKVWRHLRYHVVTTLLDREYSYHYFSDFHLELQLWIISGYWTTAILHDTRSLESGFDVLSDPVISFCLFIGASSNDVIRNIYLYS